MDAWSIEHMSNRAHLVVIGTVKTSHGEWQGQRIHTWHRFRIERVIKGTIKPTTITIRQLGGTDGTYTMLVPGGPKLAPGKRVLLFLRPDDAAQQFHIIGLSQGVFHLDGEHVHRDLSGLNLVGSNGGTAPRDLVLLLRRIAGESAK